MARALLDTNVLVHAAYEGAVHHEAAAVLVLRESKDYCLAPQNLIEFAAVVTRPRLVERPLTPDELTRMADLLYRSRRLRKIYPQRGTVMRAIREGAALGITGPAWYDLFLAVTMRDAGVYIIVTDNVSDFRKFPFIATRSIEQAP
jgi:predicted nucleic acid-binding protein